MKTEILKIDNHLAEQEALKSLGLRIKSQAGISLIDFVIWFAVVGVLLALLYGVFGPSQTQTQSQSLLSELQTMQTGIRNAYNGQSTGYTGITAKEVIVSRAYPTSLSATADSLTSSYAGKVTISSDDGNGQSFSLLYSGVPSGVCQRIISKLASGGGWVEIQVEGTAIWSGNATMPTKAAIDAACSKSNVAMKFISN